MTRPIDTDPPGADVFIRRYDDVGGEWLSVGRSPIREARLPRGMFRWKVQKDGYRTLEFVGSSQWVPGYFLDPRRPEVPKELKTVHLTSTSTPEMVVVPALSLSLFMTLQGYSSTAIPASSFLMDKYEVTNEQYQKFVDAGGYARREYWTQEFMKDGRTVTWEEAMATFRDRTGRPGPATWEVGRYPAGQARYPVSGVSWYEAAAYAQFAGKSLPTVYHWVRAAGISAAPYLVPFSNIEKKGLTAVGVSPGVSPFGVFDMAGNVAEWCWNEQAPRATRYILGGSWQDPAYRFTFASARSPFDRSETNGFRLAQYSAPRSLEGDLTAPIPAPFAAPDFTRATPASDPVFRVYRDGFAYDPRPLDAKVLSVDRGAEQWIRETVDFTAVYGQERVPAYLFLPRSARPPYQTIVFFPGANAALTEPTSDPQPIDYFDFLLLSGRAVLYPVYKGTHERQLKEPVSSFSSRASVDLVVQYINDVRRSVDYLETRQDVDKEKLAYVGYSWGAANGPLALALDHRFKSGVLMEGGFQPVATRPEIDAVHYAPRVTVPVLMLNGDSDTHFTLAVNQKPLFALLGTPPSQKRHVLYPGGGHGVFLARRSEMIKETLDWLDHYFGPVSR